MTHCLRNADTLLVDSSLVLARSQSPGAQASGVHRIDKWHTSDAAMHTVIQKGGVDVMLSLLDARDATTRLTALDVLLRWSTIDSAREQLVAGNAAARVQASCEPLGDGLASKRCISLAKKLGATLQKTQ